MLRPMIMVPTNLWTWGGRLLYKINLPNGYTFTDRDIGDDSLDSDVDNTGVSGTVSLGGDNNVTLDAGMYNSTYYLGDFIWEDSDKNGIQDANESGMEGISITLYDKDGNELNSTKTDENGTYEFSNLKNGEYYIVVDKRVCQMGMR